MVRPPIVMDEPDKKGIVGDMAIEALKRAGYTPEIISEPPPRAMQNVATKNDAIIVPLARLKDREPKFTWIAVGYQVTRSFYALENPANSFSDAAKRYKAIAVERKTAAETILLENGISPSQLVDYSQEVGAIPLLLSGRIDAWFNWDIETSHKIKAANVEKQIKRGDSIGTTDNYIACSKICNSEMVAKIKKALEDMEKDGTTSKIKEKYLKQ